MVYKRTDVNLEFVKVYEDKLCKLQVSSKNEPNMTKIYKISSNEN